MDRDRTTHKDLELFSFIRRTFWPVKNSELPKVLSLAFLIFFSLFNQNLLRILKDSILISEVSAEITNFAKICVLMPLATLFIIGYTKATNHYRFASIYYVLIISFTTFFAFFAFVLYPNVEMFHPDQLKTKELMAIYPNLKWYIALFGNWAYVVFYVLAELWPNIFYILMCWHIANQITSSEEAGRVYTSIALIGNSSAVLVGWGMSSIASNDSYILKYINSTNHNLDTVQIAIMMLCFSSVFMILIIRYIDNYHPLQARSNTHKLKLGIKESLRYILESRYLWLILIISAAFGLTMNLIEGVWRAKIKELYPTMRGYMECASTSIMWTGIVIMIVTVIGNNLMRFFGWLAVAMITPVTMLVTGVIFFALVIYGDGFYHLLNIKYFESPLAFAVFIGMVQNIITKGTKYSVSDASREMLYIPLNEELKTKGKAAVDIISSKIGKSLSSLIQMTLFTIFPFATYDTFAILLMIIFITAAVIWILSLKTINVDYQKLLSKTD